MIADYADFLKYTFFVSKINNSFRSLLFMKFLIYFKLGWFLHFS